MGPLLVEALLAFCLLALLVGIASVLGVGDNVLRYGLFVVGVGAVVIISWRVQAREGRGG